jgi:TonB-linked SusC/RagA family outer membrane protein
MYLCCSATSVTTTLYLSNLAPLTKMFNKPMRNFIFSFLALILLPGYMSGQVKGKILDKSGMGIPGAFITASNSNLSAYSDFDGSFNIDAKVGQVLKITLVGFESQSLPATTDPMTITMKESEDTALREVVVIGYGSAKKRDLTGSIVKVQGKEIADKPNPNPIVSVQGKVAGLSIVNSGKPGEDPDVRIRGTVSRYQTKPLYVVDGIFCDDIKFMNAADIESMEVLKDASSLAIFGVRGANGVIIVTSKKAKEGKTTVNYNSSIGFKNIGNTPSVANGDQFRTLYDEQRVNQGQTPYSQYDKFKANTDWIDQIQNDNALVITNNLSFSNGSEKNKFYFGLGHVEDDGLIDNEKYKKFTFNINNETQVTESIKIGVSMNGYNSSLPQLRNFENTLRATPIVSPRNSNGMYNQLPLEIGAAQIGNPLAEVEGKKYTQLNEESKYIINAFVEIKIIDGLKFRGSYLTDSNYSKGRGYLPVFDVYVNETDETTPYGGNILTNVNEFKNDYNKSQQDYNFTYNKDFGKHDFTLLAGYNRLEEKFEGVNGTVTQYIGGDQIPYDKRWWYLNVYPYGDPTTRFANSDQWDRASVSYLARVLYNYDGKYIFNASFRRDGSSELSESNRWQNFWSLGGAWDITKEGFMQDQSLFNLLKIKGSYGILGNQYSSIHYPAYPAYTTGSSAIFGESIVPAYVLAYRNNPDLQWETVTSYEGGIEMGLFDNKLNFEAAYFNKTTKDLLTFVDLGSEKFYTNAGEIENHGFEFSASWNDDINENFSYSISGNATTLDNKVISVYEPGFQVFEGPSILTAGAPIGSFYGYVVEGLYQSYADILTSPPSSLGDYAPGDFKYKDVNGDGKINTDDRTIIGNPSPDVSYGFSLSATYKQISLSLDFQGVYGNEIYRDWGNGSTFAQFNYRTERLDRWTGAGTSNWEPRLNDASGYNKLASTYMIEDGSYLRLRNIQLAYDFDSKFLEKTFLQSLRLYLNAQNPFTWAYNSGFTPEAGGSPISFGKDTGGYPLPAITSFGLNLTF